MRIATLPNGATALVLATALALFGFGCSQNRYDGNGNGGYNGMPDTTTNGIWQDDTTLETTPDTVFNGDQFGDGSTMQIEIRNDQYEPQEMTVAAGTTVTWINRDLYPHTVTAGQPGRPTGYFDSGNIQSEQTYSFTFDSTGTYEYYDKIHPRMRGKITVEQQ